MSTEEASLLLAIQEERTRLADYLTSLSNEQWLAPSLCTGWKVKDVVAHLVTPFEVSAPALARRAIRFRSVGKAMDDLARDIAWRNTPEQLVTKLRDNVATKFRPPTMPYEAPLTDIVAHSADIRWALTNELDDWADPHRTKPALNFLTTRRAATSFVRKEHLDGLRFVTTDLEWKHGRGPSVEGPALTVMMAMLGRPKALQRLAGDGVPSLQARVTAEA